MKLTSYLNQLSVKILILALENCPTSLLKDIFKALSSFIGYFRRKELQIASLQMQFVKVQDEKARSVDFPPAIKIFSHVGEAISETFLIKKFLSNKKPLVTETGYDVLPNLLKQGKGAIALSAHLGCFELLAAYHISKKTPVSVIGRYPNFSWLGELLQQIRNRYGTKTIWREESPSRAILRALKDGHVIAALIDQDLSMEGIYVPFFNCPARYTTSLISLAVQRKTPIISTFIVRTSKQTHHVITEEIQYDADASDAVYKIILEYSQRLENIILQYPEQWIWWHRRWRHRPEVDYNKNPELLRRSDEYISWLKEQNA